MKRSLSFAALALILAGCTSPTASNNDRLRVVTTFYPLAYMAERVGGDKVDVTVLTPPGVEPHDFEPTARQIASIYEADVFLRQGMIDPWSSDIEGEGTNDPKQTFVLSLLGRQKRTDIREEDPHTWMDPYAVGHAAERVAYALSAVSPADWDYYNANANTLEDDMTALRKEFQEGLADCALREIIVSHDAFDHLAVSFGITVHSVAGLSPEEEPSAKRIAELAKLAKTKGIDTIFFETLVSPELSETIASEVGAKTAVLNPLEGLTQGEIAAGKDYASVMRENLQALRTAMRCQ